MNIEQEARDLLNAVSQERAGYDTAAAHDNREELFSLEAVCRALEARNETQPAFDAYRREVSEASRNATYYANCQPGEVAKILSRFIIPEPVDPLSMIAREMVVADGVTRTKNQEDAIRSGRSGEAAAAANEDRLRAALAKIGGKITFEGAGA